MHESGSQQARVVIAVLCGLPGSGKTNLCQGLARVAVQHRVAVHHLCLDTLLKQHTTSAKEQLLQKHNGSCLAAAQSTSTAAGTAQAASCHAAAQQRGELPFTAEAWQASRQRLLQETRLLLQQQQQPQLLQEHEQQSVLLLVDDINHYRSMRYEFVQVARTHGAAFVQIHMDCPMELAVQRNSQRQGADVVPAAVVAQLAAAFEQPQPDKLHWEAATLTVHCSTSQVTQLHGRETPPAADCAVLNAATAAGDSGGAGQLAESVWRGLQAAWGPPLQPPPSAAELASRRAAGSAANAASGLHALDLASRTLLHHTLAACALEKRAGAAAALNAHRKQLLEGLRQQQQQQQQAGPAATGEDMQHLLDAFKQLCAGYT